MRHVLCLAGFLAFVSCAAERTQRPPELDPSNPDAPESAPLHVSSLSQEFADAGSNESEPRGMEGHDMSHMGGGEQGGMQGHDMSKMGGGEQGGMQGHDMSKMGGGEQGGMQGHDMSKMGGGEQESGPDAGQSQGTIYTCPMHPEVQSKTPGKCPKCGMKLVPKSAPKNSSEQQRDAGMSSSGARATSDAGSSNGAVIYTCPMHPEVHSKTPGKCPKCGMKLVPKKADESPDAGMTGHHMHGGTP